MNQQWTIELLCSVLRESEWWERLTQTLVTSASWSSERIVACWLGLPAGQRTPDKWDPWAKPLAAELYALEAEIKSGTIYGSPAKCAICGGDTHGYERDWWKDGQTTTIRCCENHWPCTVCVGDTTGALPAVAAILRARRILGKQAKPSPSCTLEQSILPVKAEPVKCCKCESTALPQFLLPYSGDMRDDPRRLCQSCHKIAEGWKVRQVSHHVPLPEPDRAEETRAASRREVLLGLVRGAAPCLQGTFAVSLDPRDC